MNLIQSLSLLSIALFNFNASLVVAPVSPKSAQQQVITTPLDIWIKKLQMCESGGDDQARNPMDTDGTESLGRFQFKTPTFYNFAKLYNVKVTDVWNGDEQEILLRKMIQDKSVNLKNQFPDCIKNHIGMPPIEDV